MGSILWVQIVFGKYTIGAKSACIRHVHACDKQNENILNHIVMKYVNDKNMNPPKLCGYTQNKGHLGSLDPKSIPYFTINSSIILVYLLDNEKQ